MPRKAKQASVKKPQPTPKAKGKRVLNPSIIAKGAAALAKWRAEKAAAQKAGPKALKEWQQKEDLKKALKKTTPTMAIKNFCIACVDSRSDITNCTSYKCPLYIYRPYQKGSEE